MTYVKLPPPGARGADDLDQLLRDFFHAEMPHPWPGLVPPLSLARPRPQRRNLFRSRFVLAASVALLLLGNLCLFRPFTDSDVASTDGPGKVPSATRTKDFSSPPTAPARDLRPEK